ncbi:MAG TPA: DUF2948 family protein [Stellaceae bacterium]|nr:DUF2948 family protein [Stellaceae bacterium]
MDELLRLRAADDEDLAVLSACLQDALVAVGDMEYSASEQRFVLVANRFRWEASSAPKAPCARILTGITIEGVTGARRWRIDPRKRDQILALLTLRAVPEGIELTFAGGRAIRLDVDEIKVRLQDFGEDWPALARPCHEK